MKNSLLVASLNMCKMNRQRLVDRNEEKDLNPRDWWTGMKKKTSILETGGQE